MHVALNCPGSPSASRIDSCKLFYLILFLFVCSFINKRVLKKIGILRSISRPDMPFVVHVCVNSPKQDAIKHTTLLISHHLVS